MRLENFASWARQTLTHYGTPSAKFRTRARVVEASQGSTKREVQPTPPSAVTPIIPALCSWGEAGKPVEKAPKGSMIFVAYLCHDLLDRLRSALEQPFRWASRKAPVQKLTARVPRTETHLPSKTRPRDISSPARPKPTATLQSRREKVFNRD